MALQFQLSRIYDPSGEGVFPGSLIARVVSPGTYTLSELADDITRSCSLTRADVIGCMEAMAHYIRAALAEGYIVQLDGLGRLRLSVRSDLCTPEEAAQRGFSPAQLVRQYRVPFLPDKRLLPLLPDGCRG